MSFKKIIPLGLLAVFLVVVACFESKNPSGPDDPDKPTSTKQAYGVFRIQMIPEDTANDNPAYTKLTGTMADGPVIEDVKYIETMSSGQSKLFKRYVPFCENCPDGFKCFADDSCLADPNKYSVGNVTLSGMKSEGVAMDFVSVPGDVRFDYQLVSPYPDYPPASEGDMITLSAAGKGSVKPFTIKVPCIAPLEVSNEEVVLDGKDITLKWEPPTVAGISTMSIRLNLSYHGGKNGEIICETEDDGSVTIPGDMIEKLKSYGIAGYPCAYFTRKSVAIDTAANAQVIVQCEITKELQIPDLISCTGEGCPEGMTCGDDRRCRPIN